MTAESTTQMAAELHALMDLERASRVTFRDILAVGLTVRQMTYWTDQGYLHADQPGSGRERTWETGEETIAATMLALVKAGMTVVAAHQLARHDPDIAAAVLEAFGGWPQ